MILPLYGNVSCFQTPEVIAADLDDCFTGVCGNGKFLFDTGIGRADAAFASKDGTPVTEATFKINRDDIYFRFSITDTNGKRAYSNAYFTDELEFE